MARAMPPPRDCFICRRGRFSYYARLDEQYLEGKPENAAETEVRFRKILDDCAADGEIRRLAESMPKRLKSVLDADGGPINN